MMRKFLVTAGASVALVLPLAGSAVAAPAVPTEPAAPGAVLAQAPCQNEAISAGGYILGGAAAGIPGGPAGALAGAIGGLIGGGVTVANCLGNLPVKNRSSATW